ncbi:MAG: prepilin-type N-terminal cleavage/methylation domain-containing protein [Phycisphaerae bacterium]
MSIHRLKCSQQGFSLVEVVAVVAILAIVAAIAVTRFAVGAAGAERKAFIQDVQIFLQASEMYIQQTGEYLEDSGSGNLPRGWEDYVDVEKWTSPTPIGGCWDYEKDSWGIKSGFGVHFHRYKPYRDAGYMLEIDEMFDDGDLTTGRFRQIASDRFYYIIEG